MAFSVCVLDWIGRVHAQNPDSPAEAYTQAVRFEKVGAYREAAKRYERADRLSPTPQALRSAARMRLIAKDFAMAATHAETLLRRYPKDAKSLRLGESILEKCKPRIGRLEVRCTAACQLNVEGLEAAGVSETQKAHNFYLQPKRYKVKAVFSGGGLAHRSLPVEKGGTTTLVLEPGTPPVQKDVVQKGAVSKNSVPKGAVPKDGSPARSRATATGTREPKKVQSLETEVVSLQKHKPAKATTRTLKQPALEQKGRSGWSPTVFLVVSAASVALGAATLWSGLQTKRKKESFLEDPTAEIYDEGVKDQRRTNILIGATSAVALASVGIGIFATDWSRWRRQERKPGSSPAPRLSLGVSHQGAKLQLGGHF